MISVCYPVSHWTAQSVLSWLQLATSELAQQQAEKQVLIRQTREKELDYARLWGEWLRNSCSQTPLPWTWALNAHPIMMLLICKAVKTAIQSETSELKNRCHNFWESSGYVYILVSVPHRLLDPAEIIWLSINHILETTSLKSSRSSAISAEHNTNGKSRPLI